MNKQTKKEALKTIAAALKKDVALCVEQGLISSDVLKKIANKRIIGRFGGLRIGGLSLKLCTDHHKEVINDSINLAWSNALETGKFQFDVTKLVTVWVELDGVKIEKPPHISELIYADTVKMFSTVVEEMVRSHEAKQKDETPQV